MSFRPTKEQAQVIACGEGCFLVTAPPGSGKTLVLTQRVVRILDESRNAPFRILALSFTNKAAEEMRSRIEAQVGDQWKRVTTSTFHAFCRDVLVHYGDRVGFDSKGTIYDNDEDRRAALTEALDRLGLLRRVASADTRSLDAILAEISTCKKNLERPENIDPGHTVEDMPLGAVYDAYNAVLRSYRAYDFDDLLFLCYELFTQHPRVARHYRRQFRYILIDEAQDMNGAQYGVLQALAGDEHRNIMLVCDTNQYIYRFAGASDRYVKRFEVEFAAEKHQLTLNFRSAKAITDVANRINPSASSNGRPGVPMMSATPAPGRVVAQSFADEEQEAAAVVQIIQRLLDKGMPKEALHDVESTEVRPEDVCVLARARYLMTATLEKLEEAGLPYVHNTRRAGLFESRLYCVLYQALRLLHNPRDLIGRKNLLRLVHHDEGHEAQLTAPLQDFFATLAPASPGREAAVLDVVSRVANKQVDVHRLFQDLESALVAGEEHAAGSAEADIEAADHRVLADRWQAYRRRSSSAHLTLAGFLGELSLGGRSPLEKGGVRVLTVHAAKGLEFKVVILIGLNDGNFPDFRATTEAEKAEEQRNMYVAVTRARRLLYLLRPRTRQTRWGPRLQDPSPFLHAMGITMQDR